MINYIRLSLVAATATCRRSRHHRPGPGIRAGAGPHRLGQPGELHAERRGRQGRVDGPDRRPDHRRRQVHQGHSDRRRDRHAQQHLRVQRDHRSPRHHLRAQRRHEGGLRSRRRRRRDGLHRRSLQQRQRCDEDRTRSRGSTPRPARWSRPSSHRAPAGGISDMQLANGKLYIGGAFTAVGGHPRTTARRAQRDHRRRHQHVSRRRSPTPGTAAASASSTSTSATTARTLVAVGNFKTVNGQSRPQIVMARPAPARQRTVSAWATERYTTQLRVASSTPTCATSTSRPSGDYMVVVATGAQSGGVGSGTLCDSASRWELGTAPTPRARTRAGSTTAGATRSPRPRSPAPSSTSADTSAG